MPFFQRLASGIASVFGLDDKDKEKDKDKDSQTQKLRSRSLEKQSSRSRRTCSISINILESHTKEAIAAFVQDKHDKGECKPHVFNQFWLQFPKLEAGFEVVRCQLEAHTASRDGPLPVAALATQPAAFGLQPHSQCVEDLARKCSGAAGAGAALDFVGLVMVLLVSHLTEPGSAEGMHPDVRTALSCLELAFTHFNSARHGRLDKREVAEALCYEAAKAHTREGRHGRTSNRLAQRLFEGLDWEHDDTISFENFLRGILRLLADEFGDEGEEGPEDDPLLTTTSVRSPLAASQRSSAKDLAGAGPGAAIGRVSTGAGNSGSATPAAHG